MARKPKMTARSQARNVEPSDGKMPTVNVDELTARLQSHNLPVKRVTSQPDGPTTIEWRKPPTEAELAFASELVPGAGHAT